jgi:hypothetical protein
VLIGWYLYRVTSVPRVRRPAAPIEEQPDEPQAPGEYFSARPVRRSAPEANPPSACAASEAAPPAPEPSSATKGEASEEPAAPAQTSPEEDWWG